MPIADHYKKDNPCQLNPLFNEYQFKLNKGTDQHISIEEARSNFRPEYWYGRVIAKCHKHGLQAKLGNAIKEIPASEFCVVLKKIKALYDVTALSHEDWKNYFSILKYIHRVRVADGYTIRISWEHWKRLRQILKTHNIT